jgi:hypothetical protein
MEIEVSDEQQEKAPSQIRNSCESGSKVTTTRPVQSRKHESPKSVTEAGMEIVFSDWADPNAEAPISATRESASKSTSTSALHLSKHSIPSRRTEFGIKSAVNF